MNNSTALSLTPQRISQESHGSSVGRRRLRYWLLEQDACRWTCAAAVAAALVGITSCSSPEGGPGQSVDLFNGKDLTGWKHVLADPSVPRDKVWQVREGMIICRGEPVGFLYSEREFTNFRFEVEYRWAPGTKPGNSGIFSRVSDISKSIPRSVEVQLAHKSAGDVMGLQGLTIAGGQPRHFHVAKHELAGDIDGVKKLQDAEAVPGEWNRVEILAQGGHYTVWVNGQKINEASGVEVLRGPVGLQSEGGEIHFRKVRLQALH